MKRVLHNRGLQCQERSHGLTSAEEQAKGQRGRIPGEDIDSRREAKFRKGERKFMFQRDAIAAIAQCYGFIVLIIVDLGVAGCTSEKLKEVGQNTLLGTCYHQCEKTGRTFDEVEACRQRCREGRATN